MKMIISNPFSSNFIITLILKLMQSHFNLKNKTTSHNNIIKLWVIMIIDKNIIVFMDLFICTCIIILMHIPDQ